MTKQLQDNQPTNKQQAQKKQQQQEQQQQQQQQFLQVAGLPALPPPEQAMAI